jgi:hypothetical protein
VDKYKLSKLKEDALTQLDDKSLHALTAKNREEAKQHVSLALNHLPSTTKDIDNSQDISRKSEDIQQLSPEALATL